MSKITWLILFIFVLVEPLIPLHAQTSTGSILGAVLDQSGAVVPGATVAVKNKATSSVRALTANAEGLYSAAALPAGDYELRVEMPGFRTVVRDAQLPDFDGIWCVPASPYENTGGALDAIRYARHHHRPFLGSCGGFQHAVIEYARNVRGLPEAAHAETDPDANQQLIAPPECPLVEQTGEIVLLEDSRLGRAYGRNRISEGYHCSYGMNARFEALLLDGDPRVTARDPEGAIRAIELSSHPFFVATLFQSERRALRGEIPPLVAAFIKETMNQRHA